MPWAIYNAVLSLTQLIWVLAFIAVGLNVLKHGPDSWWVWRVWKARRRKS